MPKVNAGKFEIDVWTGGWPVWCHLKINGVDVGGHLVAEDLADFAHVIERARMVARGELRKHDPAAAEDI